MRVRMFGLRVLAAVLSGLWTIAAALVLLGYRPGGPIDGLVVAGPVSGGPALRRRRLELGLVVAVAATVLSGSAFAAAAIANDFALRDRAAISSRFGPTTGSADPPACTTAVVPSPAATL